MYPNLIILTGGLSGSSVLAKLISEQGYWLGDSTKEINYNTFENSKLVDLNIEILHSSGYRWNDVMDIPPPSIERIRELAAAVDKKRYFDFIKECDRNAPWLWKDPRMCYSIYFWRKYIDIKKCKFILMSRDVRQSWTGIVLRGRMPISYDDLVTIEKNCVTHAKRFLHEENISYLNMTFEDLILNPEASLKRINEFLGMNLNISHFKRVYHGQLFRLRWSGRDFLRARMKFSYYKFIKRDPILFPRKVKGKGSGWHHLKKMTLGS